MKKKQEKGFWGLSPTYEWEKATVKKINIGTEAKGIVFENRGKDWGFGCIDKDFDIKVGDEINVLWAHGKPSSWEKPKKFLQKEK